MTKPVMAAFRTNKKVVKDHLAEVRRRSDEFGDRLDAYKAKHGVDGVMLRKGFHDVHVVGLPYEKGQEIPPGWRLQRLTREGITQETVVPDKRTKLGKELAEEMADLSAPYLNSELPGMPDEFWHGDGPRVGSILINHPSVHELSDQFVYVTWDVDVDQPNHLNEKPLLYDPKIWKRIKLSEFFIALEAHEKTTKGKARKK